MKAVSQLPPFILSSERIPVTTNVTCTILLTGRMSAWSLYFFIIIMYRLKAFIIYFAEVFIAENGSLFSSKCLLHVLSNTDL